jgi:Cu(I)/Ag(I) efflux system membrane fusion protein
MKSKLIIIAFAAICFAACGNSGQRSESAETKQDSTKQDTSLIGPQVGDRVIYQCPMHPEEVSDKAGQCPKCGMDLEKVTIRGKDTIRS